MEQQLLPLHARFSCKGLLLRARQPLEAIQKVSIEYAILRHLLFKRSPAAQSSRSPLVTRPGIEGSTSEMTKPLWNFHAWRRCRTQAYRKLEGLRPAGCGAARTISFCRASRASAGSASHRGARLASEPAVVPSTAACRRASPGAPSGRMRCLRALQASWPVCMAPLRVVHPVYNLTLYEEVKQWRDQLVCFNCRCQKQQ